MYIYAVEFSYSNERKATAIGNCVGKKYKLFLKRNLYFHTRKNAIL